jgi:sucrose-6-phosphate hydrolase SacC (GH32 family)
MTFSDMVTDDTSSGRKARSTHGAACAASVTTAALGDLWGHMSWGHAVSRDLVRWKELPVAIPEGDDAMIFTGSSVVDANNTSGLCRPSAACTVSIYTGHTPRSETKPRRSHQDDDVGCPRHAEHWVSAASS